jgi:predicted RNase H-like nuclease (RuvC/YqgF family)
MINVNNIDQNAIQNIAVPLIANMPQNDVLYSVQSVIAVVVAVILAAYPLMQMFKKWNSDKAENSKSAAEAYLYTHLQEQIERTQSELESTRRENAELKSIIRSMEDRIKKLESADEIITKLKNKLDEKDSDINIKNATLAQK